MESDAGDSPNPRTLQFIEDAAKALIINKETFNFVRQSQK